MKFRKNEYESLSQVLAVAPEMLKNLDFVMQEKFGRKHVLEKVLEENNHAITRALKVLNSGERTAAHIRSVLRKTIIAHEAQVFRFLNLIQGKDIFEKAATLARGISTTKRGFFLKKSFAKEILRRRPPKNLLAYLKLSSVDDLFSAYDVTEAFSALRFMESDEWMHETFEEVYSAFTPGDFEEREVELRVLGPVWHDIAKKFVEKKHHNVSHLKEFGVVFLNPIQENMPGKFLRDFALLLHYFHEIEFYSKLFERYAVEPDFASRLKSLLRGDVPQVFKTEPGEWLIVQRYLVKENRSDVRLFLPRVNPESMHWSRGERDLTLFTVMSGGDLKLDLQVWSNLDWVACPCEKDPEDIVSFDLEDNAMSLVAFMEGKPQNFIYHQREAMWTKIFSSYVGGEAEMEKLLITHFDKGIIVF